MSGDAELVIDAHVHLWQRERNPQDWIDSTSMSAINRDFWVEDLARVQRESGIDGAIVVQAVHSLDETRDLLAASDGTVVRGVVGWVDLEGDVEGQLSELRAGPGGERLVGIRHLAHLDPDVRWLERPSVGRGLEQLAGACLPFDLVVLPGQLAMVADVVSRHPQVSFVLDHIGKPPIASGDCDAWKRDLEAVAVNRNVVAKLSGITIEADWSTWSNAELTPAVTTAIDAFGPERLMFGSDWPLVDLCGGLDAWRDAATTLTAGFSQAERTAFFSSTALTTYSLERDDA